jgi:hypothetical protein
MAGAAIRALAETDTAGLHRGVLADNGIAISMDGKGAWRDNVFVEQAAHQSGRHQGRMNNPPSEDVRARPNRTSLARWKRDSAVAPDNPKD